MPKLLGYYFYAFVAPGYVHPKGYTVEEVPVGSVNLDQAAERQEKMVEALNLDVAQCAAANHDYQTRRAGSDSRNGSHMAWGLALEHCACRIQDDSLASEWDCSARLRRAIDVTRTDERTVFVRIHIPPVSC